MVRSFATVLVLPALASALPTRKALPEDDTIDFRSMNSTAQFGMEEAFPFVNPDQPDDAGVEVECNGKAIKVPKDAYLIKRNDKSIFICNTPKVASSTVVVFIHSILSGKLQNSPSRARTWIEPYQIHALEARGQLEQICDVDFSMAFVRNPFDRLKSGYVDKVNTLTKVPGKGHASFDDFMHALHEFPPSQTNVHFRPISMHCHIGGDDGFPYTKLFKIETELKTGLVDAFTTLGYKTHEIKSMLAGNSDLNANSFDSHDLDARLEFYAAQPPEDQEMVTAMYFDDIKLGNYAFNRYP